MKQEPLRHLRPALNTSGTRTFHPTTPPAGESCCSELLILADGTVLAKNLTEKTAEILTRVAPHDGLLQQRVGRKKQANIEKSKSNIQTRTPEQATTSETAEQDPREEKEESKRAQAA